jgi:hypothetical protein
MKNWETVNQLRKRTSLSRNMVMRLFDKPGISVRIGRIIRFDSDGVDALLKEMSGEGILTDEQT